MNQSTMCAAKRPFFDAFGSGITGNVGLNVLFGGQKRAPGRVGGENGFRCARHVGAGGGCVLAPSVGNVVYSALMSLSSSPSASELPAPPYRVVAVDDHPIILSGVELLLQHTPDFTWLGSARTVPAAIELVTRIQPDAVVLDLNLGGGNDGIELVRQLHALAPPSALLCYTMNEEALFGLKALRAGAVGFLSKQEPLDELLAALRTVCTGGRVLSKKLQRALFDGHPLPQESATGLERLTDREIQVLRLIGLAKSNYEIAVDLGLSVKTVSAHRESIKAKLKLATSPELTRHAVLLVEQNAFGR